MQKNDRLGAVPHCLVAELRAPLQCTRDPQNGNTTRLPPKRTHPNRSATRGGAANTPASGAQVPKTPKVCAITLPLTVYGSYRITKPQVNSLSVFTMQHWQELKRILLGLFVTPTPTRQVASTLKQGTAPTTPTPSPPVGPNAAIFAPKPHLPSANSDAHATSASQFLPSSRTSLKHLVEGVGDDGGAGSAGEFAQGVEEGLLGAVEHT